MAPAAQFEPQYSFNENVLQKWTRERLNIEERGRLLYAAFRYEGTTCMNTGHQLVFDFHITLERENDSFRIKTAQCLPAAGAQGFELMCDFIERGDEFIHSISEESPLKGKYLKDIFAWKRDYNPSACFCSSSSREYKWGLVYEVLHYALSGNKQMSNNQ